VPSQLERGCGENKANATHSVAMLRGTYVAVMMGMFIICSVCIIAKMAYAM
jgi:hypothetical protein